MVLTYVQQCLNLIITVLSTIHTDPLSLPHALLYSVLPSRFPFLKKSLFTSVTTHLTAMERSEQDGLNCFSKTAWGMGIPG